MLSFLSGIGAAAILAAVTFVALDFGTVTTVERGSDYLSTRIDGIWEGGAQREGLVPETETDE